MANKIVSIFYYTFFLFVLGNMVCVVRALPPKLLGQTGGYVEGTNGCPWSCNNIDQQLYRCDTRCTIYYADDGYGNKQCLEECAIAFINCMNACT